MYTHNVGFNESMHKWSLSPLLPEKTATETFTEATEGALLMLPIPMTTVTEDHHNTAATSGTVPKG